MASVVGRWIAWVAAIALLALAAFAVWAASELRRVRARGAELAVRVVDLRDARATADRTQGEVQRLEGELAAALQRERHVHESLEQRRRELDARARHLSEIRRDALRPMPEGVRVALVRINECLRTDGHHGIRFVRADAIEDRELRDVEIVEYEPQTLLTTFYLCGRATFSLDRGAEELSLTLIDGTRLRGGEREPLPEDGLSLRLTGVWGPMWERRLPFLIRAEGEYPVPADDDAPARTGLDPIARAGWRQRLADVLEGAGTDIRYDVARFGDLVDGQFLDALLLGYDRGRKLTLSAEVRRLAVEIDPRAGTVSLLLEDGILRKVGGDTTIPSSGYRILLPGLRPQQATDVMLGLVVHRR